MKFTIQHNEDTQEITFSGSLSMREITKLDLDRFDRMQLGTEARAASDTLLDLELIFRRWEQQQPKPYAAVVCMGLGGGIPACGKQDLTKEQYDEQMKYPDRGWRCPQCRADARFDDERFEQLQGIT